MLIPEGLTESGNKTDTPPVETENKTPDAGKTETKNLDPFGDLAEFRDPESGLYLGKYKTLPDFVKGYKELSQKVREKNPEAPAKPEDYVFEFKHDGLKDVKLTLEDPLWKQVAPAFQKAGVTQSQAQEIVEAFLVGELSFRPNAEEEKKKLGDQAETIVGEVTGFVKKHNRPEVERLAVLAGESAETLKAFHWMVGQMGEKPIPAKLDTTEHKTRDEWIEDARRYKEANIKTIDTNEYQQQHYYGLLAKAQAARK